MEGIAAQGHRPGALPQATENVEPHVKDWLPAKPCSLLPEGAPARATNLETEFLSDLELSEEQRLQISKELVDLQITTHRLQEQHEAEVFELKKEVLHLESRVLELELHGGRAGPGRTAPVEANPAHHQALAQEFTREAKAPGYTDHHRLQLLGGWEQLQGEVKQVLQHHKAQQQALETRMAALGQQLQGAREDARAARQRLAAQAVVLSTCQGHLRQTEAENAQLQLQLKKLNKEYAIRLRHCAQEVVKYANGAGQAALQKFLETTLENIQAAHHSREQQLAQAARSYRKRLADLSCRHEKLLVTCRSSPRHWWTPKGHLEPSRLTLLQLLTWSHWPLSSVTCRQMSTASLERCFCTPRRDLVKPPRGVQQSHRVQIMYPGSRSARSSKISPKAPRESWNMNGLSCWSGPLRLKSGFLSFRSMWTSTLAGTSKKS
ncbi:coiled-coil domain-containing protein 78 isoform X3 [Fukomys damarensis]|uniref:coiled-coil domain-containing protein 78 isoform X3 n=1 Tax=Fukomys damarensis TaxID=885580 RepID=UPI00053FC6F4|nr:coiled-coil domain-containing protein 78 isoform X3 [Fukomys damarensis]